MALTKAEKRRIKKQKRQQQKQEAQKSKKRNKIVATSAFSAIVIVAVAIAVTSFISNSQKPGYYDEFAKCLTEKGFVVYGADWCTYTAAQRQMFGKSFDYVNYKDYTETTGVTTTPTWEFQGERYPRVQTVDTLSDLSGCPLPSEQ